MDSVQHTKAFRLDQPVAELFPLFSPEGELSWVPGWDYENVMGTTNLSEDYVFVTKTHDHAAADAIWLVKRFDREAHLVEFYKVEPGNKVGTIKVQCEPVSAHSTVVNVSYKYLALSQAGEAFVTSFTAAAYDDFIGEWQTLLEGYFASNR